MRIFLPRPLRRLAWRGDTIFEGRPFRERVGDTREYAASRRWFVDDALLPFAGRRYVRYGLPP